MAYVDNNGVILNKGLTIAQFNSKVASGEISSNDVATQLFDLSDDLPVSQTEKNNWNNKSNFSGNYNDLTNKPTLFSGSYNDLSDKPTIPDVSGFETKEDANSKLSEAKSYADTKVANLVGTAPTTLDTLQELAEAIQDNEEVVTTLNNAIGNKVDKVSGKSLVSDTEITKLANVEAGAEVNVIESVKVNGVAQTITNKSIDIAVPTAITRVWS